jgi:hypothetical protein
LKNQQLKRTEVYHRYTSAMRRPFLRASWFVIVCVVPGACGARKPPAAAPAPSTPPAASTPVPTSPAASVSGDALPARLDDQTFWSLIGDLSEPGGSFRSDNLLSNELHMQYVIPQLTETVKPRRVYMGVGPEQNFTYIAAIRPAMVFIVDIRRGNLDLQLLYKALFELSHDRTEFVSRLFARPRPSDLKPQPSVNDIFEAIDGEQTDEATFSANLQQVMDHLTKTRHLPLLDEDVAGIQYVYRAFQMFGPGLTYWSTGGFGGRMGRTAPTYWDLMLLTDEAQVNWSYLANDANFQFIKGLEEQNLIVPIVGNFGGPKAIRAVGAYLKDHHAMVAAFYLSNVEQYLYGDGLWDAFCANVATLPLDDSSTFIRSVRSGQFGYGPGGLTSVLGNMLQETQTCHASAAISR